jgi:hypothetical protein
MKDKELKLEDIEAPHTLGGASYILFRHIDLAEGGKSLAEVELRKPRNLGTYSPIFVCFYCHLKISGQSSRSCEIKKTIICMWYVIMVQDHRYLETPPPSFGDVFVSSAAGQRPNAQPPHTSNSVKNCALSPPNSSQQYDLFT